MLILEITVGVGLGIIGALLLLRYRPHVLVELIVVAFVAAIPVALLLAHPEILKNPTQADEYAVAFAIIAALWVVGWGLYRLIRKKRVAGEDVRKEQP